ncbi:acylphosphatase [Tepidiforma sp.]|uniref:acylphosphatase n=1 Tax=Tepidiforma sp. TaxID=2682230 RepID=UPI002ADDB370|nr:acylphosphatase [Tepidiforma sp.]
MERLSPTLYTQEHRQIIIRGQVQGIGIRLWLRNVANSLALYGSCRLQPDGTLLVHVQGERNLVKQFIIACKRGPSDARIDSVEISTLPLDPRLGAFLVER